jgi:ferredoxin-thioredoxin reductase catalytic subunit
MSDLTKEAVCAVLIPCVKACNPLSKIQMCVCGFILKENDKEIDV